MWDLEGVFRAGSAWLGLRRSARVCVMLKQWFWEDLNPYIRSLGIDEIPIISWVWALMQRKKWQWRLMRNKDCGSDTTLREREREREREEREDE